MVRSNTMASKALNRIFFADTIVHCQNQNPWLLANLEKCPRIPVGHSRR
jgi:hypothetical protein